MQQIQKHWYQQKLWPAFFKSNYITVTWNWFMMLAGKAAEPILTISVIYSCARLLPTVHLPVQLDNIIFVAQMIALDVGGLSLRKMANQARKDGNDSGALIAGRVSNALISIMVLNVVLSIVQAVSPIPAQAVAIVEGVLLVARAIMAVLYAHIIHSLHGESQDEQALPIADVQAEITSAIVEAEAKYNTQIRDLQADIEALKMLLPPDQGPDTDELKTVPESATKTVPPIVPEIVPPTSTKTVPAKADTTALRAVRRAVKHNPEIKPADLAKKAQISAGYASKLKTKVLAESLQVAATN